MLSKLDPSVDLTVVFMDYSRNATGTFDLLYPNGQPFSTGNKMTLGHYPHGKYLQARIPWESRHCGKLIYFRVLDATGEEHNQWKWYPGCPLPCVSGHYHYDHYNLPGGDRNHNYDQRSGGTAA